MSTEEIHSHTSNYSSNEESNVKNFNSIGSSENESLKIKLRISKKNIVEHIDQESEKPFEKKELKSVLRILPSKKTHNGEETSAENQDSIERKEIKIENFVEPKMKLRSKRELIEEENEESGCMKKKSKDFSIDRDLEKPRKRLKTAKALGEDFFEKIEGGGRRRPKKNEETLNSKSVETSEIPKQEIESFCWTCHKDGSVVKCDTCPRVFHLKCVSLSKDPSKNWICPECSLVLHAEKISTRSEAMKSLSVDQLCTLLSFAIGRMKNVPESQAFWKPVDPKEVPFYDKYITNPMDLHLLEENMKAKMYGSPQAFLADAKWLLHNSIIFNSTQSPLTSTARFLVKICRQEMAEIENCPDCYLNAHTKDDWFIEVCRKPHILIWARLKGFPFWPAKAMSTNLKTQQVDARFFGAHDKAWVPVKECYLYSKNSPQLISKKRMDLDDAFLEAEGYIKKIRQKYGTFCFAPDKTPFIPEFYDKQLQSMIPNYKEEKAIRKKRKGEQENGAKISQNGKKHSELGTSLRFKVHRGTSDESSKAPGDMCLINDDYVSEEKVLNDDRVCPEDEIAMQLEMFDTHKKIEGEPMDENSTDLDEDGSIPIPEHGYSRSIENLDKVQLAKDENETVEENRSVCDHENVQNEESNTNQNNIEQETNCENEKVTDDECLGEKSSFPLVPREEKEAEFCFLKTNSDRCEVTSTSADLKVNVSELSSELEELNNVALTNIENKNLINKKSSHKDLNKSSKSAAKGNSERISEEKLPKSFVNLTSDQKQKILNEAKLLANIDELTALGKQKVLNELGLDASQVDIRQLAQENREILETLSKKCPNENKECEEVPIKTEDFEQYPIKENKLGVTITEGETVNLVNSTPKACNFYEEPLPCNTNYVSNKNSELQTLKSSDVQSVREINLTSKEPKTKFKKTLEDTVNSKKLKLEPIVKLIKVDDFDPTVEKLNRKLRLSDEVSLLMVDGEKKKNIEIDNADLEVKTLPTKKKIKSPRARKSIPNRAKSSLVDYNKSCKNINVISVDTENSLAQKNLLKSLRLEEKKPEDSTKNTVFITTHEKSIKNVESLKSNCDHTSGKKQIKEVTIETFKDSSGGNDLSKEGGSLPPKNVTVMTNSHLIVTSNGPAIVTNQNSQPNLALTQNNLGQLSLVHLSNLTSGIQTNFLNLTNETIGLNNSVGTLYASPTYNGELSGPATSTSNSIVSAQNLASTLPGGSGKGGKQISEHLKLPINRVGATKPSFGISVKSPASLGLIASQPSKLPPLIAITGDGVPMTGEVGSVTAELNKHSLKIAELMRASIEDILRELSNQGSLEAKYKLLTLEMEKLQWRHQQEIMELKHHSERSLMELRNSLESDKQKCLGELKTQLESQHLKVISETKRKQWCANCGKEALFYCCWNTSYCDYPCQQQHWPGHMSTCAQLGNNVSIGTTTHLQGKSPGVKYQNSNYIPVMPGSNGNGNSGYHGNRTFSSVNIQSTQSRRSSEPSSPQLPVNITMRPQHYYV